MQFQISHSSYARVVSRGNIQVSSSHHQNFSDINLVMLESKKERRFP